MDNQNTNQLPKLTGSEKQIAWAEKIRAQKMPALLQEQARGLTYLDKIEKREFPQPVTEEQIEKAKVDCNLGLARIQNIMNQTYAGYWIDRKNASAKELVYEYQMHPAPGANDHPELKRHYETAK